jgi:hypothetical protein
MVIEPQEAARYVDAARALKKGRHFFDVHVHPHDIIYNQMVYQRSVDQTGLYSANKTAYSPPEVDRLPMTKPQAGKPISDDWRAKIFGMTLRKLYGHTGPLVFADHMALSGVDEILLLPVAGSGGPFMEQMALISDIFAGDRRCHLAGSIPTDVPVAALSAYVREMVERFDIKAIKLHPNIAGLDISTSRAKEWLEAVLSACGSHRLPLILHVGRNAVLPCMERACYADIDHFDGVDWSIADVPVIFAHSGIYCCEAEEVSERIFPKLTKLLRTHDHLLVDIADLHLDAVRQVLQTIDPDRILFGSDALYTTQWSMMVILLVALSECCSGEDAEERFISIMSENPQKYIFTGSAGLEDAVPTPPGRYAANQ